MDTTTVVLPSILKKQPIDFSMKISVLSKVSHLQEETPRASFNSRALGNPPREDFPVIQTPAQGSEPKHK